jgi:LmbE family N-acetylglucosaminyl deacetylase
VRELELRRSAEILGVKEVIFLSFGDGTLCNAIYHELAKKIRKEIERIQPSLLLTFEPRGVSGHIDHIVTSMVTSYVFEHQSYAKELLYFCHTEEHTKREKEAEDYFVYFPPGYKNRDIGRIVDISSVWDTKVKAMRAHRSQKDDVDFILSIINKLPKKEYFLVLRK